MGADKSGEIFELDVKQGGNGAGAIFEVPQHLTTKDMSVQFIDDGSANETVALDASLDGTNFKSLAGSTFWLGSGVHTGNDYEIFKGGDLTHLRVTVSSWVVDGLSVFVLLDRRRGTQG